MPPMSDICRGYRPTYRAIYTIIYSTIRAQQTNLFPENASQNNIIFFQKLIWHISDHLAIVKFLWLCNHRTYYICRATSQQVEKHWSNEINLAHNRVSARSAEASFRGRWCIQLTAESSPCLLYTPVSMSGSRHCPHSHSVLSASIQSSQNSRGHKRWDWDGSCIVPRCCPTSSVLHMVLRDGQVTLRSGPSHSQSWCLKFHCLGQCNITDSRGSCQKGQCTFIYRYICNALWGTGYVYIYIIATAKW